MNERGVSSDWQPTSPFKNCDLVVFSATAPFRTPQTDFRVESKESCEKRPPVALGFLQTLGYVALSLLGKGQA